jgi:hypothetical protein
MITFIAAISMFLALLFCLFVCIMFCDQISCIINETSSKFLNLISLIIAIDKLQKTDDNRKSKRTGW